MAADVILSEGSLNAFLPILGSILRILFEQGRKGGSGAVSYQMLLQNIPGESDIQEATLIGTLATLRGLGLICVDASGRVGCVSRHARYALGSLGKFLSASVPVVDKPAGGERERAYLVGLTRALESVRQENTRVDDAPLHARRIVNVLIKSRQVRHGKRQNVYLHVYHHEWKAYHLVGLSHKDDSKTDEEIARQALRQQVGLESHQYSLDTDFNPSQESVVRISGPNGVLTEYTYRLMAAKAIQAKLELQKWIKKKKLDQDWFRWFTWEEIQQEEGKDGEPIMFSTPIIMTKVDLEAVPTSAPHADDVRRSVGIWHELGCRFTREQLWVLGGLLLILPLLQFLPRVVAMLSQSSPFLDNLANIAEFGTAIVSFLIVSWGVLMTLFKRL